MGNRVKIALGSGHISFGRKYFFESFSSASLAKSFIKKLIILLWKI